MITHTQILIILGSIQIEPEKQRNKVKKFFTQ